MTEYNEGPKDHTAITRKYARLTFLAIAIIGTGLFYWFKYSLLGGLGAGCFLFSLVSFFHFNKLKVVQGESMDTRMTWFLLGLIFLGLGILVANHLMEGPEFYEGIAAALCLISSIAYCVELIMTWSTRVTK